MYLILSQVWILVLNYKKETFFERYCKMLEMIFWNDWYVSFLRSVKWMFLDVYIKYLNAVYNLIVLFNTCYNTKNNN